jgi:hypothetical protein
MQAVVLWVIIEQIEIFVTGQNKESQNQIFSRYTKASRKTTY